MATLEFLSGDWLAALGEALTASLPADFETSIALGQVVTDMEADAAGGGGGGGGGGDVRYTLVLGPGSTVSVTAGSTAEAEVVLSTSYVAARTLARGEASAATLLEQGLVKISGDARRLVEAVELLGIVGESLTDLRNRTTFR
jgi:hypothetical protein